MRQQWDFFIAHSSTDKHVALSLYHLLCKEAKVFLDSECLLLGDDWDIELSRAQQASLITIVLVSSKTTSAYYQREEIAAAIALARSNRTRHRVVPIYLDKDAPNKLGVPYGLRLKHSLYITNDHTLIACSKELLQLVQRLKKDTDAKEDSSEEYDGQSLKASKTRWVLVLSATIDEINKSRVEAIAEHLRNLSEDTQLTIVKVESGSVMLTIECTEAGFNRLRTFIDDNTLTHINGWNIEEYWTLYERMLTSKTYLSLNQDDAEFYEIVTKFILDMSFVRSWPELQRFIVKTASTKPRDWKLPVLGNHVAGGSSTQLIKAVAAIACLHMSIILIDDMLESDPRGDYHRVGSGNASNMASALQAASLEIIMLSDTKPEVKLITLRNLNEMILNVAIGQALDRNNITDEDSYWEIVRTKSSLFYGVSLSIGAFLGGATPEVTYEINQIGQIYGEMLQIHDDLVDVMAVPANPDWQQRRKSLPILFALSVEHPDRARFLDIYHNLSSDIALRVAQAILVRCGAVSYCVEQLVVRYQKAKNILSKSSMIYPELLENLIKNVTSPLSRFLSEIGVQDESLVRSLKDIK